jgi:hypothetical protein
MANEVLLSGLMLNYKQHPTLWWRCMALEVHEEIDGQGKHSLDEGQRGHVSAEVICGSGLSSLKPLSDSILTCTCFMPPHL